MGEGRLWGSCWARINACGFGMGRPTCSYRCGADLEHLKHSKKELDKYV